MYRDQAVRVSQRLAAAHAASLAAAVAAARLPFGDAAAPEAGIPVPPSEAPAELLKRLLADPDAEPSPKLPVVSLRRYAAALEVARRDREAAARRQALFASFRAAVQATPLNATYRRLLGLPPADLEAAAAAAEALPPPGKLPTVAVCTVQGPILLGPDAGGSLPAGPGSSQRVASLPLVKKLRALRADDAVKAVVLRIDSPGGCGWLLRCTSEREGLIGHGRCAPGSASACP